MPMIFERPQLSFNFVNTDSDDYIREMTKTLSASDVVEVRNSYWGPAERVNSAKREEQQRKRRKKRYDDSALSESASSASKSDGNMAASNFVNVMPQVIGVSSNPSESTSLERKKSRKPRLRYADNAISQSASSSSDDDSELEHHENLTQSDESIQLVKRGRRHSKIKIINKAETQTAFKLACTTKSQESIDYCQVMKKLSADEALQIYHSVKVHRHGSESSSENNNTSTSSSSGCVDVEEFREQDDEAVQIFHNVEVLHRHGSESSSEHDTASLSGYVDVEEFREPDELSRHEMADRDVCVWKPPPSVVNDENSCFSNGGLMTVEDDEVVEYCRVAVEEFKIGMEEALDTLYQEKYVISRATQKLVEASSQNVGRTARRTVTNSKFFNSKDADSFQAALDCFGKNFSRIRMVLPHKTVKELVNHYYESKRLRRI